VPSPGIVNLTRREAENLKTNGLVQPFNEFEPSAVSLNLNSDLALCIVMELETEYYSFSAGKLTCSALLFWIFGNVCCVKKSSRGSDSSLQKGYRKKLLEQLEIWYAKHHPSKKRGRESIEPDLSRLAPGSTISLDDWEQNDSDDAGGAGGDE
jgi:hypothetical protein